MKYTIFFMILFSVFGCNVHKIDRPEMPSCCQALYDVLYLSQKVQQPVNVSSLMDCCRQQNKIEFCKKNDDPGQCLKLMTTF
jgi:hypothetical protein